MLPGKIYNSIYILCACGILNILIALNKYQQAFWCHCQGIIRCKDSDNDLDIF
jgi:hypothetical protein